MSDPTEPPQVRLAVPFFTVGNLAASVRFYVDGLGFTITRRWVDDGVLRWCWLELGAVALMLQEHAPDAHAPGSLGRGVTICFQCDDAIAIYDAARQRGLAPREPYVGNELWVTSFTDPDGYRLDFSSPTDVAEETTLGEWRG